MATINGTRFQDVLSGTAGKDLMRGRDGGDVLRGRGGDDEIRGDDGDDRLFGQAGNDVLIGGRGDDALFGGAGNDLMIWNNGDGSDVMRGGAGEDEARVTASGRRGDVFEIASAGRGVSVERKEAGEFSLDIRGVETIRLLTGGGADRVDASGLAEGAARLIVDAGAGRDEAIGSAGADLIRGGAGADLLVGFKGDDRLFGGEGDDRFVWNDGDGSDLMRGGAGEDAVEVNGAAAEGNLFVVEDSPNGVRLARENLGLFELDLREVEILRLSGGEEADVLDASTLGAEAVALQLFGGGGEDELLGGLGGDLLVGGRGDDLVNGGDGDDRLVWNNGDGSDEMIGGSGEDVLEVNGAAEDGDAFVVRDGPGEADVVFERINLGLFELDVSEVEGLQVNGGGGDDVLDAEGLSSGRIGVTFEGGAGDDTFNGSAGDDRIVLGEGDGRDVFRGGNGFDVAVLNARDSDLDQTVVLQSSGGGGVQATRSDGGDGLFQVNAFKTERLEVNLGAGDDTVEGSRLGNGKVGLVVVDGGAGDDALRGGNGRDELIGGEGDDVYRGRDKSDVFVFGRGDDVVEDFEDGVDKLRAEGGVPFEEMTVTQDGEDALIALAGGGTIRLLGIDAADVSEADFVF